MAAPWTQNVLHTCLCLQPGERVLILVDKPLLAAGEALRAAAEQAGARAGELRELHLTGSRASLVSRPLLEEVMQADALVSLLSDLDLRQEVPVLRAAMAAFRSVGRGRWASAVYVDEHKLQQEMVADYRQVARIAGELACRLAGAREVRLVSEIGTDLRLRLGGRPVLIDSGVLEAPGQYGNLPAGEAYVAPIEASAEGRLVVDLSLGDLKLSAPVTLSFRAGQVVSAEGGEEVHALIERLAGDPWRRTVGEFGLGANPWVRARGRVTVDEKALGTAHIALGSNVQFGGVNLADTHYDCVISRAQVWIDGQRIHLTV